MLPENHTDKIQPIHAGRGQRMKSKIGAAMETWLEEENNLDKWQDNLITQWTGKGWNESSNDETFFQRDCVRKLAVRERQIALMM